MIQNKRQMFVVITAFTLILLLGTTTYAFFNYTRTGSANTIKTGKIAFNTTQNSTLTLTNLFPVSKSSVGNDYTQDTLKINITGDTTYGDGIEYLVTAEDVNVLTNTGKRLPLSVNIDVTNNLGTEDTDDDEINYFIARNAKTTSYYKKVDDTIKYDGQYLLVGYIAPGATGINGTINIKAYLDADKIAISDTFDETESDNMGTTREWVNDRTVLTTNEWNGLAESGHELSFKVRVEANEGTWVNPTSGVNAAKKLTAELKDNITEIHFVRLTADRMQKAYDVATVKADLTDTTLNEGKVLAWQDNGKLYIASTGETYLPADSSAYFNGLSSVTKIEFNNINTSRVTNMISMFGGCSSLQSLDLSGFDISHVTTMNAMFSSTSSLTRLDLSNWGSINLIGASGMLSGSGVRDLNMSGFNFGSASVDALFSSNSNIRIINLSDARLNQITSMYAMFVSCPNLVSVDLSGVDTSNVTNMAAMFAGDSSLEKIYVSDAWSADNVTSSGGMFGGCESLEGGAGTRYEGQYIDASRAHIDGGPSNKGYLTLKTN